MKKLNQLFPDSYFDVFIKWHKPIRLERIYEECDLKNQDNIFLYKIVAKRGDKYRLVYIGMSEKQWIYDRLYNKDHQLKQQAMKELNKSWLLYVSVGEFVIKNEDNVSYKWAKKHVKLIEKMLIISHSEFESLTNKKCINWFSTGEWLIIRNTGFTADNMYRWLSYGLSFG